jgi:hypothetical protein
MFADAVQPHIMVQRDINCASFQDGDSIFLSGESVVHISHYPIIGLDVGFIWFDFLFRPKKSKRVLSL